MSRAPCQNWDEYASRVKASDAAWLRALTPAARFELYADLFQMVHASPDHRKDHRRLDQWMWQQKLAARLLSLETYKALDDLKRE